MARSMKAVLAVGLLAASLVPGLGGAVPLPCDAPADPAGDWRGYGSDLANSRAQPEETLISPSNAAGISKKWLFDVVGSGGSGVISSTPVVSGGCVFITASTDTVGWLFAVDAASGTLRWKRSFDASNNLPHSLVGGSIVGSPGLYDDPATNTHLVIVLVSPRGAPYVVAVDRDTGTTVWGQTAAPGPQPTVYAEQPVQHAETFINSGAVIYDGMVFVGLSGYEAIRTARGGFSIFDAKTGAWLKTTYTIPDAEYPEYAGASIWSTAAVDTATGFAYVGGGNPASHDREHRHANALMKIDLRRTVGGAPNPTFGEIVDAFKGNTDQYAQGLDEQPACDAFGENPQLNPLPWSAFCFQLDLDFGASPNLFTDAEGNKLVGALQKSGVYHAVYADTMERAWSTTVGTPCVSCNAASAAFDDSKVYMVATVPGQMVALSKAGGRLQWVLPIADAVHFQPVSVANGVVYGADTGGFLDLVDATNGVPLARRPMYLDANASTTGNGSNGIAIAGNRVFVAVGTWVIAYGL